MRVVSKMENKLDLYNGMGVELVFSGQSGLSDNYSDETEILMLTHNNLVSKGFDRDQDTEHISFVKISVIDLVRLSVTAKSKKPLIRVALLLLGSWAAFATVSLAGVSILLTSILLVWGIFNLASFLLEEPKSNLSFISGDMEISVQFHNKLIGEAQVFMDRFFELRDGKNDTNNSLSDVPDD